MDLRREAAASMLAQGAKPADVARQIGVHRSQITRWQKDPEFQALVQAGAGEASEEAVTGLSMLVPEALKLLEQALRGEGKVTAQRARVALDVVKAAASIDKGGDQASSDFGDKLRELDARGV